MKNPTAVMVARPRNTEFPGGSSARGGSTCERFENAEEASSKCAKDEIVDLRGEAQTYPGGRNGRASERPRQANLKRGPEVQIYLKEKCTPWRGNEITAIAETQRGGARQPERRRTEARAREGAQRFCTFFFRSGKTLQNPPQ